MTKRSLSILLGKLEACEEARAWAKGKTLVEAWQTCERGDWMLWLVGKMADKEGWPTRQRVVLAACACAETVLQYIPEGEERPRKAIETARKWARGKATIEEVREASAAAFAAAPAATAAFAAASAAASAAAFAAAPAATAAFAAASAAASAAYAAFAAYAAATASAFAAYAAARTKHLENCADIVRKRMRVG